MIHQPPPLIIVLLARADIITPRQHPNHPPRLLRRHKARQTRRVRIPPGRRVHLEAKLCQHHREHIRRRPRQGIKAVAVEVSLEGVAVCGGSLVVVQLEDDLVGGEVGEVEFAGAGG